MKNKLILPKCYKDTGEPYVSNSQITKWLRSKREYIRQYFYGEPFLGNAYTDFGSNVGEALEKNDLSKFEYDDREFLRTIPRYDDFEKEVKLEMDGFFIKGYIDSSTKDGKFLLDYKTGDIKSKSEYYSGEDYFQLDLYAEAIKREFGEYPEETSVILLGRSGNPFKNEELRLTQEFKTITRKVDEKRVKEVLELVQKTTEEISDYYQTFLKLKSNE